MNVGEILVTRELVSSSNPSIMQSLGMATQSISETLLEKRLDDGPGGGIIGAMHLNGKNIIAIHCSYCTVEIRASDSLFSWTLISGGFFTGLTYQRRDTMFLTHLLRRCHTHIRRV